MGKGELSEQDVIRGAQAGDQRMYRELVSRYVRVPPAGPATMMRCWPSSAPSWVCRPSRLGGSRRSSRHATARLKRPGGWFTRTSSTRCGKRRGRSRRCSTPPRSSACAHGSPRATPGPPTTRRVGNTDLGDDHASKPNMSPSRQPSTRSTNQPLGAGGDQRRRFLLHHVPLALASAMVFVLWMTLPLFQAAHHARDGHDHAERDESAAAPLQAVQQAVRAAGHQGPHQGAMAAR